MATPATSALTYYSATPLTGTDWKTNFDQIVAWLANGAADINIGTATTTGNATIGGALAVTGNATVSGTITGNGSGLSSLPNGFTSRGDPSVVDYSVGAGSYTMDNTWRDLDLSAIVAAGAQSVLLAVFGGDNTLNSYMRFRKKGNSNDIEALSWFSAVAGGFANIVLIVPCDTNRVIQYKASEALTRLDITVVGWFK